MEPVIDPEAYENDEHLPPLEEDPDMTEYDQIMREMYTPSSVPLVSEIGSGEKSVRFELPESEPEPEPIPVPRPSQAQINAEAAREIGRQAAARSTTRVFTRNKPVKFPKSYQPVDPKDQAKQFWVAIQMTAAKAKFKEKYADFPWRANYFKVPLQQILQEYGAIKTLENIGPLPEYAKGVFRAVGSGIEGLVESFPKLHAFKGVGNDINAAVDVGFFDSEIDDWVFESMEWLQMGYKGRTLAKLGLLVSNRIKKNGSMTANLSEKEVNRRTADL